MSSSDFDWDDEEIVSTSSLRIPRSFDDSRQKKKSQSSSHANPQRQSQRAKTQRRSAQPSRSEQPRRSQRDVQGQPRRQPQQRQRNVRDDYDQPRRQRPSRDDMRSGERRPKREFADRLAATDRAESQITTVSGWRGAVLRATGGVVNLGPSAQDRELAKLHRLIRRPVTEGTVAVFSRKGGVGKTTISAYLGLTLAAERGGRIVALDGDAEAGSLGWLLAPTAPSTLAALSSASPVPTGYADLRQYTETTPEGLEVIVGDPAEMGPISVTGLEAVAAQLSRHYDISIFDTGAGVTRATGRVLVNTARTLLLVMSPSADSVRAAERTLAWLDDRPGEAADPNVNVVAVINGIPASAKSSHVERIESHFAEHCAAVVRIPWDAHLATGSSNVSLDLLSRQTRQALVELAATTVSTFAQRPRGRQQRRSNQRGARRAS